jgi:F420H(2)-dependent quinone reductase
VRFEGEYVPSRAAWVRDQIALYEASGGQRANTLRDTGLPIVVVTMRGARTGNIRKVALMRVEHDGEYAFIASKGGASDNPAWYTNLVAHPDEVRLQDGAEPVDVVVREVTGDERERWWQRAVAAFPTYASYQERTSRLIPVLVAGPSG